MDCICSIDISIIQGLLKSNENYRKCLADVSSEQLDKAFSDNHLGKIAFVKTNYDRGDCFYRIDPDTKADRDSKMGVDIPVKISKREGANGKIIMFVGESVLRKIKDYKNFANSGLLIGTPFAIVGKNEQPKSCHVYKLIFEEWLDKGYDIYITDYIKMWSNGKNYLKDDDYSKIRELSINLLGEEIKKIEPDFIVPFGKKAKEAIIKITTESNTIKKEQVIDVTHPSNNAKVHWKIEMYEELLDAILNPENCKCKRELTKMEGYKVFKFNDNRGVKNENVANFAIQIIKNKMNPNQNKNGRY